LLQLTESVVLQPARGCDLQRLPSQRDATAVVVSDLPHVKFPTTAERSPAGAGALLNDLRPLLKPDMDHRATRYEFNYIHALLSVGSNTDRMRQDTWATPSVTLHWGRIRNYGSIRAVPYLIVPLNRRAVVAHSGDVSPWETPSSAAPPLRRLLRFPTAHLIPRATGQARAV
jgi:hypothetical protein